MSPDFKKAYLKQLRDLIKNDLEYRIFKKIQLAKDLNIGSLTIRSQLTCYYKKQVNEALETLFN